MNNLSKEKLLSNELCKVVLENGLLLHEVPVDKVQNDVRIVAHDGKRFYKPSYAQVIEWLLEEKQIFLQLDVHYNDYGNARWDVACHDLRSRETSYVGCRYYKSPWKPYEQAIGYIFKHNFQTP